MRLFGYLLAAGLLTAQQPDPAGLLRGVLLERDAGPSGELSLRASSEIYRFHFDPKTYVERASRMVNMALLLPGERIEVVSDILGGGVLRYARTVHVIEPPRPPERKPLAEILREPYHPRVELTYSGMVTRLSGDLMILRTRRDGEHTIYLRRDTRYLEGGSVVEAASLKTDTLVFVRAERDPRDRIEAYQVIWGEIFQPDSR